MKRHERLIRDTASLWARVDAIMEHLSSGDIEEAYSEANDIERLAQTVTRQLREAVTFEENN